MELGSVMETLFGRKISAVDLEQMVKDVDTDHDGEISFEEFLEKVTVMMDAEKAEGEASKEGENGIDKTSSLPVKLSSTEGHWKELGTLIKGFQEDNSNKMLSRNPKDLFGNQKKLEQQKKKQELSKQHDQMVKHFNLRRMSIDVDNDEAVLAAAAASAAPIFSKRERLKVYLISFKDPMDPDTLFRRFWDLLLMSLVLIQAIYVPYIVAWQVGLGDVFDTSVDVIFIMDLVMSFNLSYRPLPTSDLITDRKEIALNYMKCWFWIDLMASVPFDRIAEALSDDSSSEGDASAALGLLKGKRTRPTLTHRWHST